MVEVSEMTGSPDGKKVAATCAQRVRQRKSVRFRSRFPGCCRFLVAHETVFWVDVARRR